MFNNYFFLKRLANDLNDRLQGFELVTCFSQQKDELILGFSKEDAEFWIRANLDPNISLISFPETISRARKNSVNLFPEILGEVVKSCEIFRYERSFKIEFSDQQSLIFKLHGRRGNVLLAEGDQVVSLFRNSLKQDLELTVSGLHVEIDVSEQAFADVHFDPLSLIPALGKEVQSYWEENHAHLSDTRKWSIFQQLLKDLETGPIHLIGENETARISLLLNEESEQTKDSLVAANWIYEQRSRGFYFEREKNALAGNVKQLIRKSENYIFKTSEKLRLLENERNPEELANLIMANLNLIESGLSKVVLNDFYRDGFTEIKLNPKLSPQKNAENLYRKSKNRHQEIDKLQENIQEKEEKIAKLKNELLKIEQITDPKELRRLIKASKKGKSENEKSVPYHEFDFEGWQILVGKHAKANDELTLRVANSNDLWLHAKDVSGSHVIVRQRPGQNFSTSVIEHAASIAAFYSKRSTDSVCPVIHTLKKHVRKRKGAPAGQVIVEKEKVVIVEPLRE